MKVIFGMVCLLAWCYSITGSASIKANTLSEFDYAKNELLTTSRVSSQVQEIPLKRIARQIGNVGTPLRSKLHKLNSVE